MPANKKHLTKSFHQRFAKISAGFLGGYLVTSTFFMMLSFWLDRAGTMVTMIFGGFMLWAALLIIAFLFKNGWLAWAVYVGITICFSGIIYLNTSA